MNTKMTSLVAGIALLAGVGIANAEERLTAASMDGVTAAGFYRVPTFEFSKVVDTDVTHELEVVKTVYSNVNVVGNLADAEALSECTAYGGCLSETLTYTGVNGYGGTTSYSESLTAN
jgi:hypothetical protein